MVLKKSAIWNWGIGMAHNNNDQQGPNNWHWNKVKEFINTPIIVALIAGILSPIILSAISGIFNLPTAIATLTTRVGALEVSVRDIQRSLMNVDNDGLSDTTSNDNEPLIPDDFDVPLSYMEPPSRLTLIPTGYITAGIAKSYLELDTPYTEDSIAYNASPIAYDADTGSEYTSAELAEQKLLLPYIEGEQEIYFYGQLSTEGYWDGECIVNIYENGCLILITDAEYNNGELLTYNQVFPYTTPSRFQYDVWVISARQNENSFNSGETWYYFREGSREKAFDFDEVTPDDILSVQDFKSNLNAGIEGYYCGRTSSGKFNDSTGNAYMVKFFEDGTVRTLYVGNFENGMPNDTTGNAWMIGKNDPDQATYSYYWGNVKDGSPSESDKKHWQDDLTQGDIEQIIGEMTFGCDITWNN